MQSFQEAAISGVCEEEYMRRQFGRLGCRSMSQREVCVAAVRDAPDLSEAVLWHLGDVGDVLVLRVVDVDGDDLVVALALVNHVHDADASHPHEAHWHHRLLHHNEDILHRRCLTCGCSGIGAAVGPTGVMLPVHG